MQINEIKRGGIGKTAIPCWIVRFLLLESVGLFPCQSNRFPFVKFEVWRKVERADHSSCIPNTDEVFPIFLFDVGNSIVSFIISVRNKDSLRNGGTVSHLHQCRILIHLSSFLDKNVLIGSVQQIIYSVDMQQTVMLLTIASGIIGIHILRISKDLEIRAVCRKQPVTFVKTLFGSDFGKLMKQIFHSFRQKLCSALHES